MLAPAAWPKHTLSKEGAFPLRAEMLRAIDPDKKARSGRRGIRPDLEYPVIDTAAHGWEQVQVI